MTKLGLLMTALMTLAATMGMTMMHTHADADGDKDVREVNDKYTKAARATDAAALEAITTDDFVYVNDKGLVLPRATVVMGWKMGAIKFESYVMEDEKFQVKGDCAWMTGKLKSKGQWGGQSFEINARVVRIFTKTPKGWLVAHAQLTPIAESS